MKKQCSKHEWRQLNEYESVADSITSPIWTQVCCGRYMLYNKELFIYKCGICKREYSTEYLKQNRF